MKHYSKLLRIAMVIGCMAVHYSVHASFSFFKRSPVKSVQDTQVSSFGVTKTADIHSSYDEAVHILEKAMPDDCTRLTLGYLQELRVDSSCKKQAVEWILPEGKKLPVQALLPFIGLYPTPPNPSNKDNRLNESAPDQCMIVSNGGNGYGTVTFCNDAQNQETATARIARATKVMPQLATILTLPRREMLLVCKQSRLKDGDELLGPDQASKNNGERVGTVVTLSDGSFALSHYRSHASKFELYHGQADEHSRVSWNRWDGFLGNKTEIMCPLSHQRLALVEQGETGIACRIFSLRDKKFALERTLLPMPQYASTLKEYVLCQLPGNRLAIGGTTGKIDIWNCNSDGKGHAESTIILKGGPALKYVEHIAADTLLIAHTQGFELWDIVNNKKINAIQLDPEKYTVEQVFNIKKGRYFLVMNEREGQNTWKKISQIWAFKQGSSRIEQAYERHVASRPKTPSPTNSPAKNSPTKK